jgi:hypothetical protein
VPADPSSSIPAALAQLAHADPLRPAEPPHLLAYLATLHDPRRACGRRHPLVAILAMAAAAVLTGARSMAAIAEWAADAPQPVRAAFGAGRDAPDRWVVPTEATIRRTLARVDPTALAAVIGAWLGDRDRSRRPGPQHRRWAVAVDGKTLRGAKGGDGRQVHLLAAMDHTTPAVLAQRHVDGAPGEVPGLVPLLADLDLAGAVVTADALHTHADAAEFLVTGKQAHYLLVVKANQPTLLARCARLAWHHVPVLDRARNRAHGRVELRTSRPSPWATSAFRTPPRSSRSPARPVSLAPGGGGPWSPTRSPAWPSPGPAPPGSPTCCGGTGRSRTACTGVRDVTFAEDACKLRTGTGPQVMACPGQPCDRRAVPRRAGQPRRRVAPARP